MIGKCLPYNRYYLLLRSVINFCYQIGNNHFAGYLVLAAEILRKYLAGFKGSFFPGPYPLKRAYVRNVIDRYDALEKALLPPPP